MNTLYGRIMVQKVSYYLTVAYGHFLLNTCIQNHFLHTQYNALIFKILQFITDAVKYKPNIQ